MGSFRSEKKNTPKKVSRDYDKAAQEYRASIKVLYQLLVCGIGDDLTSGPSLYYVSKRTGWVGLENHFLKMTSFADVHYCIYADKMGGWVQKRPKICRRNIGMILYEGSERYQIDSE